MRSRILLLLLVWTFPLFSQDSVDVTFRYTPPQGVGTPYVPGEFNGWVSTAWPMNYAGGPWFRTARLRIGGQIGGGVAGAYQYKFFYNGASPWPNDPLNHHVNVSDNDNSFIYIKDPTIYQFLPNQRSPLVTTATPTISAYMFPRVGTNVDTGSIMLTIDGLPHDGLGTYYNPSTKQLVYTPTSPLPNGGHTVILTAGLNADTVSFITQAGFVQITTQGGYPTLNPQRPIRGIVQDTSVHTIRIVRNNTDTIVTPA